MRARAGTVKGRGVSARTCVATGSGLFARRRATELAAQLVLCPHQRLAAAGREILAGAIKVEGQHRQGGAERIRLAPPAALGRALERGGDPFRIAPGDRKSNTLNS